MGNISYVIDILDGSEPAIDKAKMFVRHGVAHATAAVVANHNNLGYLARECEIHKETLVRSIGGGALP